MDRGIKQTNDLSRFAKSFRKFFDFHKPLRPPYRKEPNEEIRTLLIAWGKGFLTRRGLKAMGLDMGYTFWFRAIPSSKIFSPAQSPSPAAVGGAFLP